MLKLQKFVLKKAKRNVLINTKLRLTKISSLGFKNPRKQRPDYLFS